MMAAEQDQILVVGGGPVGLAMALSLAVHGMSVRIIDRDSEPTDLSKALVADAFELGRERSHLGVDFCG